MIRLLCLLWMCSLSVSLYAQQMKVKDFQKLSKSWLGKRTYSIDKKSATLDFFTVAEGFTFFADGKTPVEPQQGEGLISLLLPDKTRFLKIEHPIYGILTWKVPGKPLKRKKHYQATLETYNPDEEYKLEKQWVVFEVSPPQALVWVDSTMVSTRKGKASFYLPLGKHVYRVEAPFHQQMEYEFDLNEEERKVIEVNLPPSYSYLTVSSYLSNADIFIDGEYIGCGEATSGRLTAGTHQVKVVLGNVCYYEGNVTLGEAEKKSLSLTRKDLQSFYSRQARIPMPLSELSSVAVRSDSALVASTVKIIAPASDVAILINREKMGIGEWEGELKIGDYALQTRKDTVESSIQWLHINGDGRKKEINLAVPQIAYGILNVHSNVIGAEIWINGIKYGCTPQIIKQLPVGVSSTITIRKEGYKEATETVILPPNNIKDLLIKLKEL